MGAVRIVALATIPVAGLACGGCGELLVERDGGGAANADVATDVESRVTCANRIQSDAAPGSPNVITCPVLSGERL
jgi:hypothetical protein